MPTQDFADDEASPPKVISEADARAMVRILGSVAASSGDHFEKKRLLMDALCELVQADSWVWTLGARESANNTPSFSAFLHNGLGDERFARLIQNIEHPDISAVGENFYTAVGAEASLTMPRQEMDRERVYDSPSIEPLWKAADIRAMIVSGHPVDEKSLSTVGIFRRFDDSDFSEREKQIIHIILTEVPWLHALGWPDDKAVFVPTLQPKQRLVLNLLLDGQTRKAIASELEISENTVSAYARDVYRHFGVQSQVQLVLKFFT